MIAIKHRYTDTTLCEFDVETVKQATEKGKADLYGADLRGADLREHEANGSCWCKPTLDEGVWLHHSMDGRQLDVF